MKCVREALRVVVLLLLLGALPSAAAEKDHGAHAAPGGHGGHAEIPAGSFSPHSLYHLASTWSTATGQRLRLRDLRGKIQVVVMAYTSCEYACPILLELMKNLEASLPPTLREQVGFVLVSFDPERDTPEVLQAYSKKHQFDAQRWTLLHGTADDVLELAVLLGVKYKKEPQGDFSHSNLLTVLNREGEIVHRHLGLTSPMEDTLAAIRQAAQGF